MPEPHFTTYDRRLAHAGGISLDDPPSARHPLESAYDDLLESYECLRKECAQAHREANTARDERDQARGQRTALAWGAAALCVGWAFTLWLDGRLIP